MNAFHETQRWAAWPQGHMEAPEIQHSPGLHKLRPYKRTKQRTQVVFKPSVSKHEGPGSLSEWQ